MVKSQPQISASILSADFARLGESVDAVLQAGVDRIHFDVMDNHYVPNLTIGPMVCQALRNYGITAPLDVHLMVQPVDDLIQRFGQSGATTILFHPDATHDIDHSLQLAKQQQCQVGLVLNIDTPMDILVPVLPYLDRILLMSVKPGFGGQALLPAIYDKVPQVIALLETHQCSIPIEVDGGIKLDNMQRLAQLGITSFVTGSALFGSKNYAETIKLMRQAIS